MSANVINAELRAYYESVWSNIRQELQHYHNLDHPQFISVNDDYTNAPTRLMIVGMEPTNWGVKEYGRCFGARSVADLIKVHATFNNSESKPELQSRPFWRISYRLQKKVNLDNDRFGFAYSNLVKLTENGKTKSRRVTDAILQFPILEKEIELTKPQVIVFFTGFSSFYMGCLQQTFDGLRTSRISDLLLKLTHPMLPDNAFLTAHPRTLDSKGRETTEAVLETIARSVK